MSYREQIRRPELTPFRSHRGGHSRTLPVGVIREFDPGRLESVGMGGHEAVERGGKDQFVGTENTAELVGGRPGGQDGDAFDPDVGFAEVGDEAPLRGFGGSGGEDLADEGGRVAPDGRALQAVGHGKRIGEGAPGHGHLGTWVGEYRAAPVDDPRAPDGGQRRDKMKRRGDDEEVFDGRIRFHPDRLAARQVPDNERGEEVAEVVLFDPVGVDDVHVLAGPTRRHQIPG